MPHRTTVLFLLFHCGIHTHTHSLILSYLSLSLSLSLSHTHTHTHTLSLSFGHAQKIIHQPDGTNLVGDDSVAPGTKWTYRWQVPDRTGPLPGMSSMVWMYHSHKDETGDTNAGLFGYMVITRKGMGRSATDPSPKDVDDEFFSIFSILNENSSIMGAFNGLDPNAADADTHLKRTINGYLFCNGFPFTTGAGRKTRWYIGTLGTEADLHTITWDGMTGTVEGHRRDVVGLLPAAMAVVDITPQVCSSGFLHCQVQDHRQGGMMATLKVGTSSLGSCPIPPIAFPTRAIFIAADIVEWDFFPSGINQCTGTIADRERTYVEQTNTTIGSKYLKALYREYTDATFTKLKNVTDPQRGYLGPVIELSVGEAILVVFKNNLNWDSNIQPHGIQSTTTAAVKPRGYLASIWTADPQSGPLPSDPSSIAWLYHSTVNVNADQQAGLYGAVIVRDALRWTPADFDKQYVMSFSIVNENNSPFLPENMARYLPNAGANVDPADPDFQESNFMHSINGYVFCNVPEFTAVAGQKVRWHLISVGSSLDLHSVTWRDYSVVLDNTRRFAVDLLPGLTKTVDMVAHSGKTLIQCDVTDHQAAGMQGVLNVI